MPKHSLQSAGSAILASVAYCLFALVNTSSLAWAEVSGTLNYWTATAKIERIESGDIQASVKFDDNGTGGTRRGSLILVTNLGLGSCEVQSECNARALERRLPVPGDGRGWFHYCVAPATEEGTPKKHKQCWSRPGMPAQYGLSPPPPPATGFQPGTLVFTRSPYDIVLSFPLEEPKRYLDNDQRDWTTLVCLSGGAAPDGTTVVGIPFGCRDQIAGGYIYLVDTPIEVEKRP
jgi:hypothetical protein